MVGKIIGIVSLKGGVGKTSIVSALGGALASLGKKVLLIDGNLSSPNLGLHFNIVNPEITLHDVLERGARPSEAVYPLPDFDLMPASLFRKLNASPLKLKDRISYLRRSYDVIVIDSSPALDEETLGVILASDGILVVTTPDHPTMANTLRAVKLAKQRGTPIIGLVLNKVYNKNFELSMAKMEDCLDIPVMAVIPHDLGFLESLSEFTSYPSFKPKSKASEEFRKLAALVMGEKYDTPRLRNFFGWIAPERQEINRQIYYEEMFK